MQTGLDRLLRERKKLIKGKRVALLAHPASVDKNLRPILNILQEEGSCQIVALFGPEHGIDGAAQDMESVTPSPEGAIPTFSLYGNSPESLKPTPAMLKDVEVLICDLQDVGSRYYTFSYTMAFCMETAKQTGTHVLVLDRPNPINGHQVEGNLVGENFRSFVGNYPLTNRHGMTMGELAQMFNQGFGIHCELTVVPMKGWHRRRYMDEIEIPWVMPSPNMPTVDTAVVYPGMCLLEGTEVSEGRGTTKPFEIFGAPYLDPEKLVNRLKDFRLPGVAFRPIYFKPTFHKFAGEICGGAQIHVTRRKVFKPLLTGVAVLKAIDDLYPKQFKFRDRAYEFVKDIPAIDLLMGTDQFREQLKKNVSLPQIERSWEGDKESFTETRRKYLIYT